MKLTKQEKGVLSYALLCAIRDRQTFREAYDHIKGSEADSIRKREDKMIKKFTLLKARLEPQTQEVAE